MAALFRDASNLRLSLMSFGFDCGNGWYGIIYDLFERLEPLVAALDDGGTAFQIFQVKEKFGSLLVYINCSSDEIDAAIEAAGELSIQPANPGSLERNETGWQKSLCPPCRSQQL